MFELICNNFALADSNFYMLLLTRMISKPSLANSYAIASPIPSEPPVTSAHPPLYLFLRLSLRVTRGDINLKRRTPNLNAPTKKEKKSR